MNIGAIMIGATPWQLNREQSRFDLGWRISSGNAAVMLAKGVPVDASRKFQGTEPAFKVRNQRFRGEFGGSTYVSRHCTGARQAINGEGVA